MPGLFLTRAGRCQILLLAHLFSKPSADRQQTHSFSTHACLSQSFLLSAPFYFQRLLYPSAQHSEEPNVTLEKGVSKHSRYTRCSQRSRTTLIPPTTWRTAGDKIRGVLCSQHCRCAAELSPCSSMCCEGWKGSLRGATLSRATGEVRGHHACNMRDQFPPVQLLISLDTLYSHWLRTGSLVRAVAIFNVFSSSGNFSIM